MPFRKYYQRSIWGARQKYYTTVTLDDTQYYKRQTSAIARAAAMAEWGNLNSVKLVKRWPMRVLYKVDGWGHGGYILITSRRLDIKYDQFLVASANVDKEAIGWGGYAYAFEEDCNWAVLSLILSPEDYRECITSNWSDNTDADVHTRQSLEMYNSNLLHHEEV